MCQQVSRSDGKGNDMLNRLRYFRILPIALALCGLANTKAGTNEWTSVLPPCHRIIEFVLDPTFKARLYALDAYGPYRFIRTTDDGVNWTEARITEDPEFAPKSIDGSQCEPFVLYCSGVYRAYSPDQTFRVYKSEDRSESWELVFESPTLCQGLEDPFGMTRIARMDG